MVLKILCNLVQNDLSFKWQKIFSHFGLEQESSLFSQLQTFWTPVFAGVTAFNDSVKIQLILEILKTFL